MMGGIAAFLMAMAGPMVMRMLLSVGVGTVTFVALTAAVNALLSSAKTATAGLTGVVFQLVAMAGFFDAMGIAGGALVSYMSWALLKKFALRTG